jgi:hypothetical protein
MVRKILVLFFIITLVFMSGCTQPAITKPENTITPKITEIPTSGITAISTPVAASTVNLTTTVTIPGETPLVKPDPTDVSQIQFTHYSDNDFSLDYPSDWNISKATYTSYICTSTQTSRCYQTEVKTIGPFDFKEDTVFKKPTRIVTFTSADGKQKFVAFTSDFIDNMNGNFQINPVLEWAKNQVTEDYPNVSGSAVGDYQYSRNGNTMISSFSVSMPAESDVFPLAFSMKNYVSNHHLIEFAFISDNENIQRYRNLKDRIFSSITLNDVG